jgi:hypothetical protein
MATVVAIITSMVAANATQSITTPNAVFISYNLVAGANSAAITPVTNKSVLVMGCCTDFNGAGHVSLLHIPSPGGIGWAGLEAYSGTPVANTGGLTTGTGVHIVWIDFSHQVDIQTASADTIRVHNGSTGTRGGNVTLIW